MLSPMRNENITRKRERKINFFNLLTNLLDRFLSGRITLRLLLFIVASDPFFLFTICRSPVWPSLAAATETNKGEETVVNEVSLVLAAPENNVKN